MQKILVSAILKVNSFFPQPEHPFNSQEGGVHKLNYTDFEYKHTSELLQLYQRKINISDVLRGKKILDIGCGGGGKAIYIAEKYNSMVTGVDTSEIFIDQAISYAKQKGVNKNVELKNMDIFNNTFSAEEFDAIIMSDVIEHIPNTDLLFEECYRILKKGGVILFDFASYYHYFGHHIWDTVAIPWLHVFATEALRIDVYKASVSGLSDGEDRVKMRIGEINNKESFTYLNKITRRKFEKIIKIFITKYSLTSDISYFMLKNIAFFSRVPVLRELFIRHIVGVIKK